jgi:zinc/manganese transport system ATP-binding protein
LLKEDTPPTEPAVVVEHLHLLLGGRAILEDLSLVIYTGEFVTILGPNGAGKTTLLKLLLGLLKPDSGKIRVLGKPPTRGNKAIGYVPQNRELEVEALRARDVVGFGFDGDRWGIGLANSKKEAAVNQVLEEVSALAFADAPVGKLSGGEQQRLLIAQALLTNPKLLFFDEPLANLDIASSQEVINLISRISKSRHITVLLVTHDVNPLLPVTDRVLYLANGHGEIGKPDQVITSPILTQLYGSPVEVIQTRGRIFVIDANT